MKKVILVLMVLLFFQQAVLSQAKQRKELLLQIGALQVYMDYARKGYSAVSKGLHFIGDAKRGEVKLHGDYFTSLVKINPKVQQYYKTAEIIALQFQIMKACRKTYTDLKSSDLFHGSELEYIERSFERLLENCSRTLDELLVMTSDSKVELRDDERIARIDALHEMMLADYNFCIAFSKEARLLWISKAGDQKDSRDLNGIYGL